MGQSVNSVSVGGERRDIGGSTVVVSGMSGCVKVRASQHNTDACTFVFVNTLVSYDVMAFQDVRVGNGDGAILRNPTLLNAQTGCRSIDACADDECAGAAVCTDLWNAHECSCPVGRFGAQCRSVCSEFDPCENNGNCVSNPTAVNRCAHRRNLSPELIPVYNFFFGQVFVLLRARHER